MRFSDPHFEEPLWLLLAVIGPILLAMLHRYASVARRRQLAEIASPRFVAQLTRSHSAFRRRFKNALLLLAVAAIGVALARPQWGELQTVNQGFGEDIVFVVDCSNSMLARDVLPNRLQRSKFAILDFVRRYGRGRVGLVAFAGTSFLQCPLTLDYDAFDQALQALDDKTIPVPGTDVGGALRTAVRTMDKDSRRKLVALVTDGEDLEKRGITMAESLKTNGVVVFTIGVGSPSGSEIHVFDQAGQPELLKDPQGNIVRSRLDEDTLRAIARATGGDYFPLGRAGEGLAKMRGAVEVMARARDARARTQGVERFHALIAAALVLLVVESLVGTRRWQTLPEMESR
jgi:Ca-activated chloride channel family protein